MSNRFAVISSAAEQAQAQQQRRSPSRVFRGVEPVFRAFWDRMQSLITVYAAVSNFVEGLLHAS
jgi:hypothetical protein